MAVLDTERAALVTCPAVILPAPWVDVAPEFAPTRYTAELNTSRNHGHTVQPYASWGPLAVVARGGGWATASCAG